MNKIVKTEWSGVSSHLTREWQRTFQDEHLTENLSAPCPNCHQKTLHQWYQVGEPYEKEIEGNKYMAKGGGWQWCSSCKIYEHFSGLVPKGWKSKIQVDPFKLSALPEAIEEERLINNE